MTAERAAQLWRATVAAIADMPDVIGRLSSEHIPDPDGRCRACTVPGQGTPGAPWPCALAVLARDAHDARRRTD